MNTKLILAICCAIGMSAIPFAGAHLTNPAGSLTSAFWTGDNCRYAGGYATGNPVFDDVIYPKNKGPGPCPNLNGGVSGTYVGATTVYIEGDVFPLTIAPLITLLPEGNGATGFILCDMEVLSLSAGVVGSILFGDPKLDPTDILLDETFVDSAPTGTVVPDGTFDDGGFGGACHTDAYDNPNFNTPGCSGTSHAEDGASGPNVWIGAACDFSEGVADDCQNFIFTGGATAAECIASITCQITSPATCSPTFVGCGSDGTVDAVNNGEGGGSVQFEAGTDENTGPFHSLGWLLDNKKKDADWEFFGVRYPTFDSINAPPDGPCPTGPLSGATAATFVYQGVKVNAGDIVHKAIGTVTGAASAVLDDVIKDSNGKQSYPNWEHTFAIGGWIDWTSDSLGEGTDDGHKKDIKDGLTINPCKLPLPVGPFPNLGTLVETVTDDPTTPVFDPLVPCSKTNP